MKITIETEDIEVAMAVMRATSPMSFPNDGQRLINVTGKLLKTEERLRDANTANMLLVEERDHLKELLENQSKSSTILDEGWKKSLDLVIEQRNRYMEALQSIAHGPVGFWNAPEHAQETIHDFMQTAEKALHPPEETK